jgi:hypothetical protein
MALKWRERVACEDELEIDKERLIPETRLTTSKGSVEEETCRERERERGMAQARGIHRCGAQGGGRQAPCLAAREAGVLALPFLCSIKRAKSLSLTSSDADFPSTDISSSWHCAVPARRRTPRSVRLAAVCSQSVPRGEDGWMWWEGGREGGAPSIRCDISRSSIFSFLHSQPSRN